MKPAILAAALLLAGCSAGPVATMAATRAATTPVTSAAFWGDDVAAQQPTVSEDTSGYTIKRKKSTLTDADGNVIWTKTY